MSKKEILISKKLAVLELVKSNKDILFGNFKNTTHTEKANAWKQVLEKAQSLELVCNGKNWQYARDNLFGLWKCRALAKRDNMQKTGTEGGKNKLLDEVDTAILEIIGKNSAVISGLNLPEPEPLFEFRPVGPSLGSSVSLELPKRDQYPEPSTSRNVSREVDSEEESGRTPKKKRMRTKKVGNADETEKEKLKLELLKVEIYHRRLQCRQIEEMLDIPISDITRPLYVLNNST